MSGISISKFHVFNRAPTSYLILAESRARFSRADNLKTLSLPVASFRDAYDFIPPEGRFEVIILFIRGNDLFVGFKPFSSTAQLTAPAAFVCEKTGSSVFVLGIHEQDENRSRATVTNGSLKPRAGNISTAQAPQIEWRHLDIRSCTSGRHCFKPDKIHLNSNVWN